MRRGEFGLEQEVAALEVRRIAVIDEVACQDFVAGSAQHVAAGPTCWLPLSLSMARDGGLGHVRAGVARPGIFAAYAAWSAREIELQALATLAALARTTPSAAHFLTSHQLLVQKFAADRNRQKASFGTVLKTLPSL